MPGILRNLLIALISACLSACCTSMSKLVDKRDVVSARHSIRPPSPGPFRVDEAVDVVHDPVRNRDIPIRIYAPAGVAGPLPVVLFSHGIGESRDSYVYLGNEWASHGYIVIHLTHAGTDKAVLKKGYLALYRETKKPENWRNRPLDVSRVIDRMLDPGEPLPLVAGRVDASRIAVAGHSAGAFTALALAGMRVAGHELGDPRVKVAIAMSMPKMGDVIGEGAYASIHVPLLHMTGTCDGSIIYRTRPRDRRAPFTQSSGPDDYLVTFEGVDHDTFSNADPANGSQDGVRHRWIREITTTFLDGYLRGEPAARAWFAEGGLSAAGAGAWVVEKK
jgi:predicted dienelactone hydrolase